MAIFPTVPCPMHAKKGCWLCHDVGRIHSSDYLRLTSLAGISVIDCDVCGQPIRWSLLINAHTHVGPFLSAEHPPHVAARARWN